MTIYKPGDVVYVEGVVIEHEPGEPYGAVLVDFPAATDIKFDSDGLPGWHPAALVFGQDVAFPVYARGTENMREIDV